jgi:hypothetical protein
LKSRFLFAGAAAVAAVLAVVAFILWPAGAPAAASASAVTGPAISLSEPGHPTLVAFLAMASKGDDPSRLQVTTVKSMADQYGAFGLRTVIVDTSRSGHDDLVNDSYDWQLGQSITLMSDPAGTTADGLHVAAAPTTLLLAADGHVLHTWHGLAVSQDLAAVLQPMFKP